MKVYQCHTRFLATGLNRYIPINGLIYMYENSAKLAIQDSGTSNDEWFNIKKCDVEYNTLPEVNWFSQNIIDTFFTFVKTLGEDEAGGAPTGVIASTDLVTLTEDVDFTAETNKRWSENIGGKVNEILRGRIWIDEDPTSDFEDNFILNIYNNSDYRAENKIRSLSIAVAYRELSVATTGIDATFNIGGTQIFQPEDLIQFMGTPSEINRVEVIGAVNPNTAIDTIDTVYGIGTGLTLITEYDVSTYTNDVGSLLYFELIAPASVTVSIKSEIVIKV